jgi:hypothetical protein
MENDVIQSLLTQLDAKNSQIEWLERLVEQLMKKEKKEAN